MDRPTESTKMQALVMPLDGESTKLVAGIKKDKITGEEEPFILIQPKDIPADELDENGVCCSGNYPVVVLTFPQIEAMKVFTEWLADVTDEMKAQMAPEQKSLRDMLEVIEGGKAQLDVSEDDEEVIRAMQQKGNHTQH